MDSPRYLELFDRDAARLREVAVRDVGAPVPSCPGWTAADLLLHVGEVYLHKVEAMRRGAWPDPWPLPPEPAEPAGYFDRALSVLRAEFAARKPGEPALTWYDADQTVGFWVRRMALETVVHRVDAELAAGEPLAPIPDDLALDGIDEILVAFLAYAAAKWPEEFGDGLAAAEGRTVSIQAGDHRWLVRPSASGVEVAKGSTAEADASVTGSPHDVLLWLWGRQGGTTPSFSGGSEPVERLRGLLKDATQ
ncbi:maleylpyruvate isomerase family mycothiol-dependent enzyme [Nonomuraea terrae]|uniref:Maleylpyruvate isomerase family mycothiol-dependent enzyme n=1 Tax=Nonomuraea terrae TaxID=2530383 RepID=A0A4V2YIB5_9ACTN|nr:maleylpyruvate isomerase N-terminal domain-containing protein [Nonomuraea terrae]TDD34197.1 maleylpyruvate isomerase family mycothiol-dependent enzyme [Nonomuraea terrae]